MLVQRVEIRLIVSMISSRSILGDRGYPNGVEAHVVDVVQSIFDALPIAPAVFVLGYIAGRGEVVVASGKSIGQYLVYAGLRISRDRFWEIRSTYDRPRHSSGVAARIEGEKANSPPMAK